jgi:hypothetical protein
MSGLLRDGLMRLLASFILNVCMIFSTRHADRKWRLSLLMGSDCFQ